MNLADGIFDDTDDIGDSLAESQQTLVLSSRIEQYSCHIPVSKRIKYTCGTCPLSALSVNRMVLTP